MYSVFNVTFYQGANLSSLIGWPLERDYGFFCDQRDQGLFILSHGLVNLLSIIGLYLLIVLYIGPKFMQNRKPFELKNPIRIYNAAIILVNSYMVIWCLSLTENGQTFFDCRAVDLVMHFKILEEIAPLSELFLLSRLADFLDTFWFVLRKKQSQITFLHIFHHSYVPLIVYISTRLAPITPSVAIFPFINSAVHIVMYIYYLLATFPQLRPYLWWKQYLTMFQLMQFVFALVYNILGWYYFNKVCGIFQTPSLVLSLVSAVIFLGLYNQFYQRTYKKSSKESECMTSVVTDFNQHYLSQLSKTTVLPSST